MMHDKKALHAELIAALEVELSRSEKAHHTVVEGATHADARPENSKDTRALEQTYLARGQALRIEELRRGIAEVTAMDLDAVGAAGAVVLGALVSATEDDEARGYFLALHGGGTLLANGAVQVVTPVSPLGRALIGRTAGDVIELRTAGRAREIEITDVR